VGARWPDLQPWQVGGGIHAHRMLVVSPWQRHHRSTADIHGHRRYNRLVRRLPGSPGGATEPASQSRRHHMSG